jgi:hypothetical protein
VAYASDQDDVNCVQVNCDAGCSESCSREAQDGQETSIGSALLQTSRSTFNLAPSRDWKIFHAIVPTITFEKVLLVGACLGLFGCCGFFAWYKSFWQENLVRCETKQELIVDQGDESIHSAASTQSQRIVRSRSRFMQSIDDDDADGVDGDWQPLRSMGFMQAIPVEGLEKKVDDVFKYIEEENTSWRLFFRIMLALGQVWGMLGLMYWSLLTKTDELMDCMKQPHGPVVGHICTYTHACLRGFPIMAANVTLVLMIRILVQNRIYYSLLSLGHVIDFADTGVLHTQWPWLFVSSMIQGGAHLLLKMYFDPRPILLDHYLSLMRKFVIPGAIFMSFFLRYAEIENTLVPLNRICERDYTKDDRKFHSLAKMKALNERILAFDARHRDVVGDVWDLNAARGNDKRPSLDDVFENLLSTYDKAAKTFYDTKKHYSWGFFRSLWPGAVLVDYRLDWHEPKTRSWLIVYTLLISGGCLVSFCSMCFFVASIWRLLLLGESYTVQGAGAGIFFPTQHLLAIVVLLFHAVLVMYFLNCTIRGMFYFEVSRSSEIDVNRL